MADVYNKRVTTQMLDCVRLLATGDYNVPALAAKFGKDESTIRRWLNNPAVLEEYRTILRSTEKGLVAKARKVIEKGMDSGEGYLALQSAQTALNRYDAAVMGEDKQEVVVKIAGYTPAPGMPQRSEEE